MNVAVSTKKCSLQNHGGVTKSHCCDSQTVANDFIGNTVVTLGGTANVCHVIIILKAKNI